MCSDNNRFTSAFVSALLLLSSSACASAGVRSPWDGHAVKLTNVPSSCALQPDLAADLTTDGFYRLDDPTHSIVDPERMKAYTASSGPVKAVAKAIVDAADTFRTTGSRDAARCTVRLLTQMAHNNTMGGRMSSSQAYYVQGWLAGAMAVAYLKVHGAGFDSAEQAASIGSWLARLGVATRDWYDEAAKKHPEGNNHLYWAGAEMAAIAAVSNRQDLLEWSIAAYKNGVDQIRQDGVLPLEMARGQRALHYHLYALTPLVFLAEFGEANGQDLYAYDNRALARLVALCVHGIADPSFFAKSTNVKQEVTDKPSGDDAYWTKPYARRFPSYDVSAIGTTAKTLSSFYLGGLPPD